MDCELFDVLMALGSIGHQLTFTKSGGKQALTDLMCSSDLHCYTAPPIAITSVLFDYDEKIVAASIRVVADHEDGYTCHWKIEVAGSKMVLTRMHTYRTKV